MDHLKYRIISIGTLSHNKLWGENAPVRTAHATTTLIEQEGKVILVDPSLPAPAMLARLNERSGKKASDITDVFCTTLRPVHRRGIEAFPDANWWVDAEELEGYQRHLEAMQESAERLENIDSETLDGELKVLNAFRAAPQKLTESVTLYPLRGPSGGSAGLLLTPPASTIVIAGDAVVTHEHLLAGQVWEGCFDAKAAIESMSDMLELADVIIPGHDNLVLNPGKWL